MEWQSRQRFLQIFDGDKGADVLGAESSGRFALGIAEYWTGYTWDESALHDPEWSWPDESFHGTFKKLTILVNQIMIKGHSNLKKRP